MTSLKKRGYLGPRHYTAIDWGGKFVGWIEYLKNSKFVSDFCAVDPLPPIIQNKPTGPVYIITLIDVLQRVLEPVKFLKKVNELLKPGGFLFVACRSGSGFDVLTLRGQSKSIFPLDHLFLPSPKGMRQILTQAGFEILELTTPGLLSILIPKI